MTIQNIFSFQFTPSSYSGAIGKIEKSIYPTSTAIKKAISLISRFFSFTSLFKTFLQNIQFSFSLCDKNITLHTKQHLTVSHVFPL